MTLACPPDTDTPGLIMENKTKPKETCLISDSSGVLPAQDVAKQTLEDAKVCYCQFPRSFVPNPLLLLFSDA